MGLRVLFLIHGLGLVALTAALVGWQGAGGVVAALALGMGLSLLFARRVLGPLGRMRAAAERYARSDLRERVHITGPVEIVELAKSMNRMGSALERRVRELTRHRHQREAILTAMHDGVLAIDREQRLIMLNRAAGEMLGLTAEPAVGRLVPEALRVAQLQQFIQSSLEGGAVPAEAALIRLEGERLLQASAAPLLDEEGQASGLLVVLADVTRLHRLESMRRQFVANVSHELRTPITSIKGFIETLLDGALTEPENARRFVEIMARQADRLAAIIDDLLALSRIERLGEGELDEPEPMSVAPLRPILQSVIDGLAPRAREKEQPLELACEPELAARVSERLLEQALTNLLDNAIKYSPAGRPIRLSARRGEGELRLEVLDQGPGIPPEHRERIFERFHRIDPARSRQIGGTGLGLAIVKHIAQLHGGRVGIESPAEGGSCFVIYLPEAAAPKPEPAGESAELTDF